MKDGLDVRAEDPPPLIGRDLLDRVAADLPGGVVDEDVETPELIPGAIDERPTEGLVLDVTRDGDGVAPRLSDQASGVRGVLLLHAAEIRDGHVGAFTSERNRDGLPDARVTAGDQRSSVAEPLAAPIALFAVIRARPQLALRAGRLLLLFGVGRGRVLGLGVAAGLGGHRMLLDGASASLRRSGMPGWTAGQQPGLGPTRPGR